jgi:TonB-dependent SusC/RagA subfamily outer membrane receptor
MVAAPSPRVIACGGWNSSRQTGPLFIVDGAIARDSSVIRALSVRGAQVKILRGVKANSLYGSRAAAGVVIVTTQSAER